MSASPTARLKLDSATKVRLERLAEARHRPEDLLVREAINQHLEREEGRAQIRRDALHGYRKRSADKVDDDPAVSWPRRCVDPRDRQSPAQSMFAGQAHHYGLSEDAADPT